MKTSTFSLQRLTYFTLLLFLTVYLLIIGQSILAPLAFGVWFSFILKPICAFYEKRIKWRIPSILLTMITGTIPVLLIIFFLSAQFVDVVQDMPSIKEKLNAGITTLYDWTKDRFGLTKVQTDEFIKRQVPKMLNAPLSFLGVGVTSSTNFFTGFFLTFIYVFLFLLYRTSIKNFFLIQYGLENREGIRELITRIQKLIQKYLYGLLLVIIILGLLNSLGLWIIGIKHPMFWGFLAGLLAIIPYVGTFIGGILPFLYALATTGTVWQPTAVVFLFMTVQGLEGNFITPNVIGSTVNVNPLAAIVSLLVGAKIWGIAGMVLSLPILAVLKELLKEIDAWRPVGFLLSDKIMDDPDIFEKRWDEEQYRLRSFMQEQADEDSE